MPLFIICNDITKMSTDAIVNAANCGLQQGGGVCGAIFEAAGAEALQAACDAIGGCATGDAVITPGFALQSKYIVHTPGPIWQGGGSGEERLLRACYENALALAQEHGCESIAFPLISTGIYRYPREQALAVAISAIGDYLLTHAEMDVFLVVFDRAAYALSDELFRSIDSYIDARYTGGRLSRPEREADGVAPAWLSEEEPEPHISAPAAASSAQPRKRPSNAHRKGALPSDYAANMEPCAAAEPQSYAAPKPVMQRRLEDVVAEMEESFSVRVLRLIDERGRTDVEIYKRANLDRKLFSKIRSDPAYRPSKATAIALAIALELNLDETRDLLQKAGFALSHASKFDLIVEYFINAGVYNIFEINEALFAFEQGLLGA